MSDILYVNLRACGSVAVSILQLEVISLLEEASSDFRFPIIAGLSYGFPSYISEGFYCLWFQDYLRYAQLHYSFLSQFFLPVDHLMSSVPLSTQSHIQFPFYTNSRCLFYFHFSMRFNILSCDILVA